MKRKLQKQATAASINQAPWLDIIKNDDIATFRELTHGKNFSTIIRDSKIEFPVHWAAQYGSVEILKYLMNKNKLALMDIDAKGCTPLHSAASTGQDKALSAMLESSQNRFIDGFNDDCETPLNIAVSKNHLNAASVLIINHKANLEISSRSNDGAKPLFIATKNGNLDMMQLLLNQGANIEGKNFSQLTPLCVAAREGKIEATQLLLEKGASIKHNFILGKSPLYFAAAQGHKDVVHLLLNNFNPNKSIVSDCILRAVKNGHVEVVKILLNGYPNNDKPLLLYIAVENKQEDIISILLQDNINVNIDFDKGETCLHIAARNNDLNLAQKLIKCGAKMDIQDCGWLTPLHQAIKMGHLNFAELLLARGANVEIGDKAGITPLHRAVLENNLEMVSLLLEHNANIMAKTSCHHAFPNTTLFEIALNLGNDRVIEVLKKALNNEEKVDNHDLNPNLSQGDNHSVVDDESIINIPYLGFSAQTPFDEYEATQQNHFASKF